MSATAAAARVGAGRLRATATARVLAPAGVIAVLVALLALTAGTWGDLDSDTGYDVIAGARVAAGDLPYRDFTYYYGPLAPALSAVAALIGGPGFAPAIALGLIVTGAIVAATYALARLIVAPLAAALASVITVAVAFIPDNYGYVLPHTYAATLGTLALLGFLLGLARYARDGRRAWLVAAGTAAGLAALCKPEVTAAAFAAAGAWLVARRIAGAPARREAILLLGPAVALPALVYGALMTAVTPRALALENLYPVRELQAGGDTLLRARTPLTTAALTGVAEKTALYAAGCVALLLLARAIERAGRRRGLLIVGCASAGALVAALCALKPDGLRDGVYYAWGWIPA
jgi:hypothetical protein